MYVFSFAITLYLPCFTDEATEPSEAKEEKNPATSEKDKEEKVVPKEKPTESTEIQSPSQEPTTAEGSDSWFSSWGVGNISKMVESTVSELLNYCLDELCCDY